MFENILEAENVYAEGFEKVKERRDRWCTKAEIIKKRLQEIAKYLNEKSDYKPGYFVNTYMAFDDDTKYSCEQLISIVFRSGNKDMGLGYTNGQFVKNLAEEGFQISFSPSITGRIVVNLVPHKTDFTRDAPNYIHLATFNDANDITDEEVDDVLIRGFNESNKTSFTGLPQNEEEQLGVKNPIGYRISKKEKTEA